jgi:hypothetical protein
MNEIKGGTKRPYVRKAVPKQYDQADEANLDDFAKPPRLRAAKPVPTENDVLPARIVAQSSPLLRSIVPGNVWRQAAFKWDPQPFAPESEKLEQRIRSSDIQNRSLSAFLAEPDSPVVYYVAGNPDDSKAKYFAAYLVQHHIQKVASANVVWHTLYGGFDNPLMREYDPVDGKADPTMLVLCGLSPAATNVKLDKARDLIERFCDIPRIIVCAGEDPLSFATTRLYTPINAMAYFAESLIKKRVEIL